MQQTYNRRKLLMHAGGVSGACGLSFPLWAQQARIRVAAASDLQLALPSIARAFERETGINVLVTFGASGNLARQLAQGLPMDVFMSADEALVARLHQSGWARDAGVVYAQGRLALITAKGESDQTAQGKQVALDADLRGLHNFTQTFGAQAKFAIANPDHAPYGRAAKAALEKAGLWQALLPHLVLGENVSQAAQFVSTGAAQAALVALSLAAAPELARATRYITVNPALHPPIIQRMALHASAGAAAQRWYTYVQTPQAKRLLTGHGFE